MAYATGTVANPAALQVIIEDFCTANGWTLNAGAGSWLSKGQSHVRLGGVVKALNNISRIGTTATADYTRNAFDGVVTGDTVLVAGASDPLYNGSFVVTVTSDAQFTYTMAGTPAAHAVGTLTATNTTSSTTLTISGANSADGLTEFCPFSKSIHITAVSWPVIYHLFYDTNPDQVSCVLNYDTTKIQTIMFGDIVKVHNSAYVGGNWFWASKYDQFTKENSLTAIFDTVIGSNYGYSGDAASSIVPFGTSQGIPSGGYPRQFAGIHCKIDSNIWVMPTATYARVQPTDYTISSLYRSPNSWNNQAQLVPIHIQFSMASSLYGYLGYVEHLRYIRIDNYEIGDIVTIGTDQWKVFPWVWKNTTARNGANVYNILAGSGTLGFACRYTP